MPTGDDYPRWLRVVAAAVVILGFLPYVAVPVGHSTNFPVACLGSVLLIVVTLRHRSVFWVTFAVLVLPVVATVLQLVLSPRDVATAPLLAWVVYSLALPGGMAAILILGAHLRRVMGWSIILSAVLVFVQFWYIRRGTLPWLWYYDVPGYHPVRENAESIVRYNNRPFGMFPEPSFMAGTLAITVLLLLVLCLAQGRAYGVLEFVATAATVAALLVSASGSAALTLGVIGFAAVLPLLRRSALAVVAVPFLGIGAGLSAWTLLSERGTGASNLSWIDRSSSILIVLDRFTASAVDLIAGLGIGMTTILFERGDMPTYRFEHYTNIPDVYSVTVRILIEMGILVGLPLLCWLAVRFVIPTDGELRWVGLAALAGWLVVSSLTITYHSAFWVCAVPGVMAVIRERGFSTTQVN